MIFFVISLKLVESLFLNMRGFLHTIFLIYYFFQGLYIYLLSYLHY